MIVKVMLTSINLPEFKYYNLLLVLVLVLYSRTQYRTTCVLASIVSCIYSIDRTVTQIDRGVFPVIHLLVYYLHARVCDFWLTVITTMCFTYYLYEFQYYV
jgi:hypothetical protein